MNRHGLVCILLLALVALGFAQEKPKPKLEDAPKAKKEVQSESRELDLTIAKLESDATSISLSKEERHRAAKELAEMGNIPFRHLQVALHHLMIRGGDPVLNRRGAEGLCSIGPSAWLEVHVLVDGLKDEDAEVRILSCQALGQMKALAYQAVPDLVKAYQKDEDAMVRRWAMAALSMIVPEIKRPYPNVDKAIPIIKEATKDPNETIAFMAKETLKNMEKPFK